MYLDGAPVFFQRFFEISAVGELQRKVVDGDRLFWDSRCHDMVLSYDGFSYLNIG